MLKREITYEDFEGNSRTDTFYFNLSKSELVEMELSRDDGFSAALQRIVNMGDNRQLIGEFKKLILQSYGEKSEDGRRFVKNDEIREAFEQTAAFDQLFMEFVTSDTAAANFIKGVVPKDMGEELQKILDNPTAALPTNVAPVSPFSQPPPAVPV